MESVLLLEGFLISEFYYAPPKVHTAEIRARAEEHDRNQKLRIADVRGMVSKYMGDGLENKADGIAHQMLTYEQQMLYADSFPAFQRTFSSPNGFSVIYSAWITSLSEANGVSTSVYGGVILGEDVRVKYTDKKFLFSVAAYTNVARPEPFSLVGGPLTEYIDQKEVTPPLSERFPLVSVEMVDELKTIDGATYDPQLIAAAVKRFVSK
ncbi:MAG TPA: hypothetical protein VJC39_03945 [Candidatus Nanoarchaeia archaeon]|nr:hypothetical protein [Candidatus Nanoarchaeia archaeon]